MNPQASRPWLAQYPEGVPAEIESTGDQSLADLLDEVFRQHAQRDMAVFMHQPVTFGQIDQQSQALGAYLQSLGMARGTRVALMMPNLPQYLAAIAAVLRAGYVVVNVNPLYTPRELAQQLGDCEAEAILILENFAAKLEEVIEYTSVRHVVLVTMGDALPGGRRQLVNFVVRHVKRMVPRFRLVLGEGRSVIGYRAAIAAGQRMRLQRPALGGDDVAFLQYTGGTTGVAKGATLLHRHVLANIAQCNAWFQPTLRKVGDKQLTVVCALPLYHIFALTICYFLGARLGMRNILIPNPRDIASTVHTLSRYRVHMFPAVNTLYNALLDEPGFARLDFSELVVTCGGGMAVQQATAERWLKVTGCPIAEGYGLSETSPVVTANRVDITEFSGTIGLPVPSTDLAIRDDAGRDLGFGQVGEICIRGPQVMAGYWQRPDETAQAISADGYFKSGDLGTMDEHGHVRIVDRKKDMILVSGFNVYPNEIEQVVSLHPAVLECAAVGMTDAKTGEAVKLYVVKRESSLTEEEVAAYCRANLAAYKRPRQIEFRDALPKSTVGKILRRELRPRA